MGYAAYQWQRSGEASERAAHRLLNQTFVDVRGKPVTLSDWKDHVLVVNFWATWCEPCKEEIPALTRLQTRFASNKVTIVGIALDSADKVTVFSERFGINYPIVIGALEVIDLARQLGNAPGGLPFTVVLNRRGAPAYSKLGVVSERDLDAIITGLI